MKNFRNFRCDKDTYFATVDIQCGFLWLKTKPITIYRLAHIFYWRFLDSGEFCPGRKAENLESRYKATLALGVKNELLDN